MTPDLFLGKVTELIALFVSFPSLYLYHVLGGTLEVVQKSTQAGAIQ